MSPRMMNWKGMNWIRQEKRLAIYLRDKCRCVYCGRRTVSMSLDHVAVVTDRILQDNDPTNLVTACKYCNDWKRDMSLGKWIKVLCAETQQQKEVVRRRVEQAVRKTVDSHKAKELVKRYGSARKAMKKLNGKAA